MATLTETVTGNIKRLRAKQKITQEVLAARANLSVSYISMLERGQRSPPLETLESLAKALETTPQKLLS